MAINASLCRSITRIKLFVIKKTFGTITNGVNLKGEVIKDY